MTPDEAFGRLDERLQAMASDFKEMKQDQKDTLVEVKKTNGRVTAIEQREEVRKGQWKIIAGVAAVFGSALGWIIKHYWG